MILSRLLVIQKKYISKGLQKTNKCYNKTIITQTLALLSA